MAVTKTHPIKSTLKAAIDYICNPEKTDGKLLVSSYGCAAETADIEFVWTRSIDKGTNLGRHLIQAFEPGEVSPEKAHEIGMQLAKEILGGKYEFVDRLIPASADFEDLLRRLQREGYEIKRGKYVSFRASDQERFTRMKTLGVDYTEDAITARIAGRSSPSRQPKQRDDRIRLLYDLQSKQGGLQHWAKLQNLKLAAKTFS